jgi:hypothetical protein
MKAEAGARATFRAGWLATGVGLLACVAGVWRLIDTDWRTGEPDDPKGLESGSAEFGRPPTIEVSLPDPSHDTASASRAQDPDLTQRAPNASHSIDELIEMADNGDARAACLLARQFRRCRESAYFDNLAKVEIDRAVHDPTNDRSRSIVGLERWSERYAVGCEGLMSAQLSSEWRYLVQSVNAGHLPSMWEMVTEPPIDANLPLEEFEKLAWYRQNSWATIQRMVAAGSIEGLLLAFSNSTGVATTSMGRLRERNVSDLVLYGAALDAAGKLTPHRSNEYQQARSELPLDRRSAIETQGRALGLSAKRMVDPSGTAPDLGCESAKGR